VLEKEAVKEGVRIGDVMLPKPLWTDQAGFLADVMLGSFSKR